MPMAVHGIPCCGVSWSPLLHQSSHPHPGQNKTKWTIRRPINTAPTSLPQWLMYCVIHSPYRPSPNQVAIAFKMWIIGLTWLRSYPSLPPTPGLCPAHPIRAREQGSQTISSESGCRTPTGPCIRWLGEGRGWSQVQSYRVVVW